MIKERSSFEEEFPSFEMKYRVQFDRAIIHHGGSILFKVKKSPCLILSTDVQKYCLDKAKVKEVFNELKKFINQPIEKVDASHTEALCVINNILEEMVSKEKELGL